MSYSQKYIDQVKLLLQVLPLLRNQTVFALKGGTAINFFEHDMPRLSVDIDLAFTQRHDRQTSIAIMQQQLTSIEDEIKRRFPEITVKRKESPDKKYIIRLFIHYQRTMIKIEPNYVMRGVLYPIEHKAICNEVKDSFSVFVDNLPVSSRADLYAGKICAALSRQHPRDLFDIKLLFETSGLDEQLLNAVTIYLSCDARPMHELLNPNKKDITQAFNNEFLQMTTENVSLDSLYLARDELIEALRNKLNDRQKAFLISVAEGEPEYDLMPFKDLAKLPALTWKVLNVNKMESAKKTKMTKELEQVFG